MVDINKLLQDMQGRMDLTIGGVILSNGVQLQNVYIETVDDKRQFRELMAALAAPVAPLRLMRRLRPSPSLTISLRRVRRST